MRSIVRASSKLNRPSHCLNRPHIPVVNNMVYSSTASFSSRSATTDPATVTTVPSTVSPNNLRILKRELTRSIDEDSADLAASPDVGLIDYMKEMKMKVVRDKTGTIKILRSVGDYNISVSFSPDADEEQPSEEELYQQYQQETKRGGQSQTEQQTEGETKEEEEDNENRLPSHSYEIDIKSSTATDHNWIKLSAMTNKEGVFVVQAIHLDPSTTHGANSNDPTSLLGTSGGQSSPSIPPSIPSPFDSAFNELDSTRLFFDDLSETSQEKLAEFLASLGIDDKMGQFVQHYGQVVRTQQYLDKLKLLKSFLQTN